MGFKIQKKEIKFVILGIFLIWAWFYFLRETTAPLFKGMFPFIAMILFNLVFIIAIFLITSALDHNKVKISLIAFLSFLSLDLISSPYLVDNKGIIKTDSDFWYTSTDVGWASLWQSLGIKGYMLYLFTYVISFALLFLIIILIASPKIIRKNITPGG